MADEPKRMSGPLRIAIKFALNILLVWGLVNYAGDYIDVTGGLAAYIVIGALITLMNIILRPILNLATVPLRWFATAVAVILVNGLFVWATLWITDRMDPSIVTLQIEGGIIGWIVIALAFGITNWLMKITLK